MKTGLIREILHFLGYQQSRKCFGGTSWLEAQGLDEPADRGGDIERERMTVDRLEVKRDNIKDTAWIVAQDLELKLPPSEEVIHVVIPARDEAAVIGGTLLALSIGMGPADQLHVVADHCRDATERIAYEAGANVYRRDNGGPAGKGQALRWWLEETKEEASADDIIVVLDADSLVAPNFFDSIRQRISRGECVIQTRVEPVVRTSSPVTRLAAYSETTEQKVSDAFRAFLGWPVRLRGTGMAFRRSLLEEVCISLNTFVEDVEMTLQLGAKKVPISFAHETYVADPKPNDQDGAVRQRARWMKGQTQVVTSYFRQILRLLTRGPAGWSLLSSVLLKPKTLLIPFKAICTALAWIGTLLWGGPFLLGSALLATLSLAIDFGIFIYGIRFAADRREALFTLAIAPIYLVVWLRSLALSAVSGTVWHRVRPVSAEMLFSEIRFVDTLERYFKVNHKARAMAVQPVVADSGD
jgi:cellulose synthase/poly-beta-1,6-N-acetylglucosamine synthase-like glycosyltransferase